MEVPRGGTDNDGSISKSTGLCPTFYLLNATSLAKTNAVQHLYTDVCTHNADIVLIVETWFTHRHADAEIAMSGYNLFRRDRGGKRKGGGLCAFVRPHVDCTVLNIKGSNTDIEIMWLLCKHNSLNIIVALCYYPPRPIYDTSAFINCAKASIML